MMRSFCVLFHLRPGAAAVVALVAGISDADFAAVAAVTGQLRVEISAAPEVVDPTDVGVLGPVIPAPEDDTGAGVGAGTEPDMLLVAAWRPGPSPLLSQPYGPGVNNPAAGSYSPNLDRQNLCKCLKTEMQIFITLLSKELTESKDYQNAREGCLEQRMK
ncbi:hypothetical protein I7I53_00343 [Histoplasma capsulatum var. duboisii H88]|uniref:Uncharacterized protein n=1 Tax=Ajellomyces capsulatus (strain H88) TaxID=544711 RepID=A0A8A1LGJ0_AJEC8|nr:hypothetical protein I7I53_00343 [Histoplasma capsulatum var. duboisii H88]